MTKHFALIALLLFFSGCATYKVKYSESENSEDVITAKEIDHTFYLIGDAGLSPVGGMNPALAKFKRRLDAADPNSTAIFLGDNIYPAGLPDAIDSTQAYRIAKSHLDAQLKTLENFKGRPLFIPGNHDWYTEGLIGLKRQEDYIQRKLDDKDAFAPRGGCPIETIDVDDNVMIIALDTEWYLTNWNKRPDINDKCTIKSREKFFEELEGEIKKNEGKTILLAMHHPMTSYGPHGGHYTFKRHIYPKGKIGPMPFLGTFINVLRRTSGASIADIQNKRYNGLKKRLTTLAQYSDKVVFVSGHEHTLQYIVENNTPQIVSGSGAKKGGSRLLNGSKFSTGKMGYATLEVYVDGSSRLRFYGVENDQEEFLYTTQVLGPDRGINENKYEDSFPSQMEASIYTKKEIDKSGFFKTLWGKRYRQYYGTKVKAPTVNLDTLFGGLTPVRKGGGHQSKSLRLRHKSGKEYVMRAMRKVSELYLQAMLFQEQYVMDDLEDTFLQEFLQDFYTGSHPYAPFTIGPLADAVGIYHTNPVLYYIPKQPALEDFNLNFGDELYMIEEHAGDGHGGEASYGFSDELISTDTMFEKLRDDEKYEVDTQAYLRARLFDMMIGDWDRHVDQWRWAEFDKEDGKKGKIYRPIPRDRDQAFSIMGDGLFMKIATRIIPGLRLMEGFDEEIRSVKGFNSSPKTYVLDVALLDRATKEQWIEEAMYLKENITPDVIDRAFANFPEEVRDGTVEEIKQKLLARLQNIRETALEYYGILNKYTVVIGTDKDDWFDIEYNSNGVRVDAYRIIGGEKKKPFFGKQFKNKETKEIWVYGLDDKDRFVVSGDSASKIKVRLIGGQNNDVYDIGGGKSTYVYDYKSKKSTFNDISKAKLRLTDDYEVNTYDPLRFRSSTNQLIPTIGFNPDDGLKIGINNTYTYNGFRRNPFTQKHQISAAYYFATSGFEAMYRGEYANITDKANLEIDLKWTSPNFAINFFGFGNTTGNPDDALGFDYNRVKLKTLRFAPSLVWRGQLESEIRLGASFESIEVEETSDRFINTFYVANNEESSKSFVGLHGEYSYSNTDNAAFPTMGMSTSVKAGYKTEVSGDGGSFGYVIPSISFDYKLISSGRLVLATKWKAHFNIGNGYEFYQAAAIGGVDGLRGFRNQRFTGKRSYYQNTDVRWSLGKRRTGILPTSFGLYGGFDYGRVWQPDQDSGVWHTSYGGGFFVNAADLLSIRAALFTGVEGARLTFGVGFGF